VRAYTHQAPEVFSFVVVRSLRHGKLFLNREVQMSEEIAMSLEGFHLINSPRWNKGTAFTDHERDIFHLHGLLPPHIGNLDDQLSAACKP
jgi:hypothetical protein